MLHRLSSHLSFTFFAVCAILFYFFQASIQILSHSVTFDEPLHIRSGLEWISLGYSPSDPLSPPFSKLPFGILQLLNINLLDDPYLLIARFSMFIFALFFLIYFYFFVKKYFFEKVALLSLLFLSLEPAFIAYTHLANSETITLICFFLVFATGSEFIIKKAAVRTLTLFIFSIILLYLTKSVFLPAFIFLIIAVLYKARSLTFLEITKSLFVSIVALIFLSIILTGFNRSPVYGNYLNIFGGGIINSTITSINYVTDPTFVETRLIVFNKSVSHEGSILYTPISFFLKTSPHLLILSISFIIFYIWKEKPKNIILTQGILLIFSTIFLVTLGNYNIGIRHLLPIIPILVILSSLMLMVIINKYKSMTKALVLLLIFVSILNTIFNSDKITYFNPLIGSEYGSSLITESNFDWGQSLPILKKENHKIDYLISYSPINPRKYGITSRTFPFDKSDSTKKLKGKNIVISHTQYFKLEFYLQEEFKYEKAEKVANGTFLFFKF